MFHLTLISCFAAYLLLLSHLHHFLSFSFSQSPHPASFSVPFLTSMKDIEPQAVSRKNSQLHHPLVDSTISIQFADIVKDHCVE